MKVFAIFLKYQFGNKPFLFGSGFLIENDEFGFGEDMKGAGICDAILKMLFINSAVSAPIFVVISFLGNCKTHFLANAGFSAWVCEAEKTLIFTVIKKVFLVCTQLTFIVHGVSASNIQTIIQLPYVIFTIVLVKKYM